jgi:alkanesulfonate monooxygenase SsuD/methylene tetrahydromethanopterin reductase-like flavin-dependent oxidoreductase (luciferase family)
MNQPVTPLQPPRFVPTLTEVVDASAVRHGPAAQAPDLALQVHAIVQSMEGQWLARCEELARSAWLAQFEVQLPALRQLWQQEFERQVRQAVASPTAA